MKVYYAAWLVSFSDANLLNSFLVARSPVFNAMFEHEMEERKQVMLPFLFIFSHLYIFQSNDWTSSVS